MREEANGTHEGGEEIRVESRAGEQEQQNQEQKDQEQKDQEQKDQEQKEQEQKDQEQRDQEQKDQEQKDEEQEEMWPRGILVKEMNMNIIRAPPVTAIRKRMIAGPFSLGSVQCSVECRV